MFGVAEIAGVEPPAADWNAAPATIQPVVCIDSKGRGRVLLPMRWGLVPSWWTRPLREWRASTFNARSEEASVKPAFRGAYRHRRCLVPVSGYYEWSRSGGSASPFAFRLTRSKFFCFAGLWDTVLIDGSQLDTFTILTTAPNDLTSGLHDRMPVILRDCDYDRWLDPGSGDPSVLFRPFPSAEMEVWPVGPEVGRVSNNRPELLRRV